LNESSPIKFVQKQTGYVGLSRAGLVCMVILVPVIFLATAVSKHSEILAYLTNYVILPPKVQDWHLPLVNIPFLTGITVSYRNVWLMLCMVKIIENKCSMWAKCTVLECWGRWYV
jgi:hypothetical protein